MKPEKAAMGKAESREPAGRSFRDGTALQQKEAGRSISLDAYEKGRRSRRQGGGCNGHRPLSTLFDSRRPPSKHPRRKFFDDRRKIVANRICDLQKKTPNFKVIKSRIGIEKRGHYEGNKDDFFQYTIFFVNAHKTRIGMFIRMRNSYDILEWGLSTG